MKSVPLTRSEQLVYDVCRRSFLSLWCYHNPRAKGNRELCDILIVCAPHIVIISVKDIALKGDGTSESEMKKWQRKAVKASIKQIHGAQRWLETATHVIRKDGSQGIALPGLADRKVHRIAVACGSRGEAFLSSGDDGKGYVHVMNEESFQGILTELDTITDFIEYFEAKDACKAGGCSLLIMGSELNLLGLYLSRGRAFPTGYNFMLADDTIWEGLREQAGFKRRKELDDVSYVWDKLIEHLTDPDAAWLDGKGPHLSEMELVFREMARERRFSRRVLGQAVQEFLEMAVGGTMRSRVIKGMNDIIYVLVFFKASENLSDRQRANELVNRSLVARNRLGQGHVVIAIGVGEHVPNKGHTSDVVYRDCRNWSSEDDERAKELQAKTGCYAEAQTKIVHHDEFPSEIRVESV